MPRRKAAVATDTPTEAEATPTATATPPADAPIDTAARSEPVADVATQEGKEKKPFQQIQGRFTSTVAGLKAEEDFRFKQARVTFADDQPATKEEKEELQAAGFRYRGNEKSWTARATPESRDKAIELAQRFKERRLKDGGGAGRG